MQQYLQCGRYRLPLSGKNFKPLVMGILNVTPDSFSDGGQFHNLDSALSRAEQMITDEVDIIDIGGESSRPGAQPLPLKEELDRVMPAVYALRDCGKPLSVDTYKPEVMREAIAAGVDMINDIGGFLAPGAIDAVKDSDCGLCVMHMQRDPQSMQTNPRYQDIVKEVIAFLKERISILEAAGVARERICIDPGFGFGKTIEHNLALLKGIGEICDTISLPILAGMSRKSMIGAITGKTVENRLAGSLAAALFAVSQGTHILRVHDVAATVDALKVWQATSR
jgi:dihydropteroate synthase